VATKQKLEAYLLFLLGDKTVYSDFNLLTDIILAYSTFSPAIQKSHQYNLLKDQIIHLFEKESNNASSVVIQPDNILKSLNCLSSYKLIWPQLPLPLREKLEVNYLEFSRYSNASEYIRSLVYLSRMEMNVLKAPSKHLEIELIDKLLSVISFLQVDDLSLILQSLGRMQFSWTRLSLSSSSYSSTAQNIIFNRLNELAPYSAISLSSCLLAFKRLQMRWEYLPIDTRLNFGVSILNLHNTSEQVISNIIYSLGMFYFLILFIIYLCV